MNKKILSLFLVVAASAILAISCNNKSTNPTAAGNDKELSNADLVNALKGLGKVGDASKTGTFDFSAITSVDGGTVKEEITGSDNSGGNTSKSELEKKLGEAFAKLSDKGFKVTSDYSTLKSAGNDENTVSLSLNVTPNAGFKFGQELNSTLKSGKLILKLKPQSSKNWN
ncbi:hypothetical protein [Brachyspira alvinipulli]|uniref:hypothetical protein n=1 Tax=Brachyspira alvinipulli TaxID=84379 RepID=UPI000482B34A|nr:hypothetical protein [Brachyspira alvinipulli]